MSVSEAFLTAETTGEQIYVYLSEEKNQLFAKVQRSDKALVHIKPEQIKCGINGKTPHLDFLRKVDKVGQDKLQEKVAIFSYPPKEDPQEIWIFEATSLAAPAIRNVKELVKQDELEEALNQLKNVLKLQELQKGDTEELKTTILQIKKELFLRRVKRDAPLYLSPAEIHELTTVIVLYQNEKDPLTLWSKYLEALGLHQPHLYFLSSLMNELEGRPEDAIPNYVYLIEKHPNPLPGLKNIVDLVKKSPDPLAFANFLERLDRQWLLHLSDKSQDPKVKRWAEQKEAVRQAYEESLIELSKSAPAGKRPTCFICFSMGEPDVNQWVEHTLVPDIKRMGIDPIFCYTDLGPGKELIAFEEKVRNADRVIILCTPELKKKCDERKEHPLGVALEIRLAKERYNDRDKYETIFPLYLKGERKLSCPSEFFEPILGSNFSYLEKSPDSPIFGYYANTFELFGGMRKIPRETSRKMKAIFATKIKTILNSEIK